MNKLIYDKYEIKRVINASGKMTILGGSKVEEEIVNNMNIGASNFFEIEDLINKTGSYIANLLNVEDAMIVLSASAGIAMSVGGIISEGFNDVLNLNNLNKLDREVIIMKGHNIDYGTPIQTPIQMGGGIIKEAGYSNLCTREHIESIINKNTKLLLYVKSHHCVQKGMLSLEEFLDIGKCYNLPVIVDAAAEEDLTKYFKLGAQIVIYSGTKALEGPTSGLIIGEKAFINKIKLQNKGIGRVLKVGKESILGLTKAIEVYINNEAETIEKQKEKVQWFIDELNIIEGISAKFALDPAGRNIVRPEITFHNSLKKNAKEISEELKKGDIAIYTRDYNANLGKIEIDIRALNNDDFKIIIDRIKDIII